jgi:hypothetical protein
MTIPFDRMLSDLCDEREDVRICLSLAADKPEPDAADLLARRANLTRLDGEILDRRRRRVIAQSVAKVRG